MEAVVSALTKYPQSSSPDIMLLLLDVVDDRNDDLHEEQASFVDHGTTKFLIDVPNEHQ